MDHRIDFQVWRRVGSDFMLVGSNSFPDASPSKKELTLSVDPSDQFEVQPGDVLGLYIATHDHWKIELDISASESDVTVSYMPALTDPSYMLSDTLSPGDLSSTVTGAPVISALYGRYYVYVCM